MINLYQSIQNQINTIPGFAAIDIEGTEEAKLHPAAFIKIQPLTYIQLLEDQLIADVNFTVRIVLNPVHRSGVNSPMLTELKNSFALVAAVKSQLVKMPIDYIDGVMLVGEDLRKVNGKYIALLSFKGAATLVIDDYTPPVTEPAPPDAPTSPGDDNVNIIN